MATHNELGKQGEQLAADFLSSKGYTVLEKNWRFGRDEIDIIVQKEDVIGFVEVKTRVNSYIGNPEEAVTPSKQKRLVKAANAYIQENELDLEARFDIIAIILNQNTQEIRHIEDAFQPQWR